MSAMMLQVFGQLEEGKAAQAAAEYNAQSALVEGQVREMAQRKQAAAQMGAIRASISKSGATSEGTPITVLAESAANAEIDALNTFYSAGREATLQQYQGRVAKAQSRIKATTTLLKSGEDAARMMASQG